MDVWLLYDGFSCLAMQWMEDLGLVPRGESGRYVGDGTRIRHDGEHHISYANDAFSPGAPAPSSSAAPLRFPSSL